jgi:N-formylglutamate amidohydrolase
METTDNGDEFAAMWQVTEGQGPILATAIHDGHALRPEVADLMALDEAERLREEDPHTEHWTHVGDTRLVVSRSRFEMDLNRPRERAVYRKPADAWGLQVWRETPPSALVERSLAQYDAFYRMLHVLLRRIENKYGRFVVLDLHTYNHHRQGPHAPWDDPALNPEINVGTDTMNRTRWTSLVDRFIADLRDCPFMGRRLDVRENVKFGGGWMSQWIHDTFPENACVLSVEVKKVFMDEWTGQLYPELLAAYHQVLAATLPGLRDSLCAGKER